MSLALADGFLTSEPPGSPETVWIVGLILTRSDKWGTLPQGCIIAYWLLLSCLCIPSLPWLAAVFYVPLGTKGTSWRLKAILHNQETRDRKTSVPRNPTGSSLASLGGQSVQSWSNFLQHTEVKRKIELEGEKGPNEEQIVYWRRSWWKTGKIGLGAEWRVLENLLIRIWQ